jgi:hypothetical protein
VRIEDEYERRIDYRELDAGGRDQVYLSFCMALAAACARRGQRMPLMLNAAFNHFPAQSMRIVLDVLSEFARHHQVVCFTRFEHVVELARQCRIPVHYLVVPLGGDGQSEGNVHESPEYASGSQHGIPKPTLAVRNVHREVLPAAVDELKFFLRHDDPIELAPSVDPVHAERLRKIGLLRVGDLLRVEPAEVASDLQQFGITADLVASWSAQSRLVCGVRTAARCVRDSRPTTTRGIVARRTAFAHQGVLGDTGRESDSGQRNGTGIIPGHRLDSRHTKVAAAIHHRDR